MSSPFRRHQQTVLATMVGGAPVTASLAPAPPVDGTPAAAEYAALLAVLHDCLRNLSDIQSHELRQPKKAEYAAMFRPWIAGLLTANLPVQDEVLTTNMIWALDYRDFDYALLLARFVIGHGLVLPERYSRTPACLLAEDVAEAALAAHESVPHDVLIEVAQLVEGHDMPDPVAAKLKKAIGRSWFRKAELFDPSADNVPAGGAVAFVEQALAELTRALSLHAECGVRKDIQRAESLQKKLAAQLTSQTV